MRTGPARLYNVVSGAATAGVITSIFISSQAEEGVIGRLSLAALILSTFASIRQTLRAPQQLREADYDLGYKDGHRDGRREGRPVVVPFPSRDDGQTASGAR